MNITLPKSVLLVGGTSGIGLETLQMLNNLDIKTWVIGRDFNEIDTGNFNQDNIIKISFNLLDLENLDKIFIQLGDVVFDGVVLSAGINEIKPLKFISVRHLLDIYSVNVFSTQLLISKLVKKKLIGDGCSIVVVGSIASKLNEPGTLAYSSSKAALISSVEVMAKELSRNRIRINCVLPGAVESPMNDKLGFTKGKSPEIFDSLLNMGSKMDIAKQIVTLLSSLSSWQTGTSIVVDGGQSIR